jgi:hypothetical protein
MRVFLSWSGNESRQLASEFSTWIQSVLQAVRPFFSPEDIEKGSFWQVEVDENLRDAAGGILFVTSTNKEQPWMLFEAGALVAKIGKPTVIPMLFGLAPADLVGPLSSLNAAVFGEEEVFRVVQTLNRKLEAHALDSLVVKQTFDMWWPVLESGVNAVLNQPSVEAGLASAKRTEREMLEEMLGLVRDMHAATADSGLRAKLDERLRRVQSGLGLKAAANDQPLDKFIELLEHTIQETQWKRAEREAEEAKEHEQFGHLLPD